MVVSDSLITPNSKTCVTLAPLATCVLTGTYTVTAADAQLGKRDNNASVNSDQTDSINTQLTVTIIANEPPVAGNDRSVGNVIGSPVIINPLSNDSDPEEQLDPKSVRLIDASGNPVTTLTIDGEGVWTVNPETGEITFTPVAGFSDNPTPASYTVKDNKGRSSGTATITVIYAQVGSVTLNKTGYAGHDSGQQCGTATAKDSIILVDVDGDKTEPVTYCFEVINTGINHLADIQVIDQTLGLQHGQLSLLNGPEPVALDAGATLLYYYEAIADKSLVNIASISATPSDVDGNPTGEAASSEDTSSADLALVIDPPSAIKTVTASGNTGMQWEMLWINDSTIAAPGVVVFDEVPAGTHFVAMPAGNFVSTSGVYCETRGTSSTDSSFDNNCYFEAPSATYPRGRVIWKGTITSDLGLTTEDTAVNEVVIRFVSVLDNPNLPNQEISNQGHSEWDFSNDGNSDMNVTTDNPETPTGARDETSFKPASNIPTLSEWMLMMLALLLLFAGNRESMRFSRRKP